MHCSRYQIIFEKCIDDDLTIRSDVHVHSGAREFW